MRREIYTKPLVLLLMARWYIVSGNELSNVTQSRSVRAVDGSYKYLVFPQGSNVQLVYCMTVGALAKPEGFFTIGVTAGLAYELPYKRTVPFRKPAEVYHRRSRRDLYQKIEVMLKNQGKDGRNCILKALCQAGKRNREAMALSSLTQPVKPFLDEILHSIFTYPKYEEDDDEGEVLAKSRHLSKEYDAAYNAEHDCDKLFTSCPRIF